MFNLEFIFMIFGSISLTYAIYTKIENNALYNKVNTLLNERKELTKKLDQIDFRYASEAMSFLDKIIQEKYKFYMYSTLMPLYLDSKIPEKKMINEIKEKIYVSVVGSLTTETKKSILSFFTEKGVEIYIHEKIIGLMNETDFKASNKLNEKFKDIRGKKLDTLIP